MVYCYFNGIASMPSLARVKKTLPVRRPRGEGARRAGKGAGAQRRARTDAPATTATPVPIPLLNSPRKPPVRDGRKAARPNCSWRDIPSRRSMRDEVNR